MEILHPAAMGRRFVSVTAPLKARPQSAREILSASTSKMHHGAASGNVTLTLMHQSPPNTGARNIERVYQKMHHGAASVNVTLTLMHQSRV
jgi:hypothetical protein